MAVSKGILQNEAMVLIQLFYFIQTIVLLYARGRPFTGMAWLPLVLVLFILKPTGLHPVHIASIPEQRGDKIFL
ncbi:hypothetical protein [Niabella sp.]|uniref:hypothetical protein n=1 Tax=Niabella sp. TaxID=1962976 RepID=UPI00260AD344|nr:hypothetical protein [Niabella sp.]